MPHFPIHDLDKRYRKVTPHESSFIRSLRKLRAMRALQIVAGLLLIGAVLQLVVCNEVKGPLPAAITPAQRQHAGAISRRFSLAGWTWAVEDGGRTVELYDPEVKAWRRIN